MFFPERIKGIKPGDRVLEVGPGSTPFPRADVLLELRYSSIEEYKLQCGNEGIQEEDARIIYYDGKAFPFTDKEFDYVICSHVLEHVPDIEEFCAEVFRVAKAGYFEYPLIYYDYVYDFPAHVNLIKKKDSELVYIQKNRVFNDETLFVRQFWYETLKAGHVGAISGLVANIMEGFEWSEAFNVRQAINTQELVHHSLDHIPLPSEEPRGAKWHFTSLVKALLLNARTSLRAILRNIYI
jgi:SAM-dependent methyltransferase